MSESDFWEQHSDAFLIPGVAAKYDELVNALKARGAADAMWLDVNPDSLVNYYDRQGRRINMALWATLVSHFIGYKRVQSTRIGPVWISTAWLGLDHGVDLDGPPIIFETMTFGRPNRHKRAPWSDQQWRHATEVQAREFHQRITDTVKARGVSVLGTRKEQAADYREWGYKEPRKKRRVRVGDSVVKV